MKYRVLLTGNNKTIINEFFTYMDFSFDCMSTSDRYDDILNHIKYAQPDALVYCLYRESPDDFKRFVNIGHKIATYAIPIIVIGDADDCKEFSKIVNLPDILVLQRPISSQNVQESITDLLENLRKDPQAPFDTTDMTANVAQSTETMLYGLPTQDEEPQRRKHILIVDDDSSVLKLIKSYLSERYGVATAISGKVALKFLESKETDLVLLDYEMPGDNGPAVLSQIRANEKTKHLPVVFLTGVTDRHKIQEVLAMQPQGYLLKPIDMERLSSTIKGILE